MRSSLKFWSLKAKFLIVMAYEKLDRMDKVPPLDHNRFFTWIKVFFCGYDHVKVMCN
jgi:hypothetical protein